MRLRLLLTLSLTTIITLASNAAQPQLARAVTALSADGYALLAEANSARAANGIPAIQINDQLSDAASAKAADMIANDYWAHVSPSGVTPWDFISSSGYQYVGAGENLAYGFSSMSDVVSGWMNSPAHRQTLLRASYVEVGFAVVTSQNFQGQGPQTIVVGEFGTPADAPAPAPSPVVATPAPPTAPEAPVASVAPAVEAVPAPTKAVVTPPTIPNVQAAPQATRPLASRPVASKLVSTPMSLLAAASLLTPSLYLIRRNQHMRLVALQLKTLLLYPLNPRSAAPYLV